MKAELLFQEKEVLPNGGIVQMSIWRVSSPVIGSVHPYKYRLYYGKSGERIVGYDNERGKGDHCHLDGKECPYAFTSVDRLIDDFLADVVKRVAP